MQKHNFHFSFFLCDSAAVVLFRRLQVRATCVITALLPSFTLVVRTAISARLPYSLSLAVGGYGCVCFVHELERVLINDRLGNSIESRR